MFLEDCLFNIHENMETRKHGETNSHYSTNLFGQQNGIEGFPSISRSQKDQLFLLLENSTKLGVSFRKRFVSQ